MPTPKKPNPTPKPTPTLTPEQKRLKRIGEMQKGAADFQIKQQSHLDDLATWARDSAASQAKSKNPSTSSTAGLLQGAVLALGAGPAIVWDAYDSVAKSLTPQKKQIKKGGKK